MPEYKCVYLCSSFLFRPGDALQDFLLILVQTNSKGRISGTTDLHFVHLYLGHIQLLKRRKKSVELHAPLRQTVGSCLK